MDVEHQHGHDRTLTQAQQDLRRTLEAKRKQLLHVLREHEDREEESGEDPLEKEPTDAADLAESAIEDNDRIALADHNLELLEEIDHALSRLDDGTYGLSEATGRPIPYERLRAVPWARYGADEAERMEQVARRAIGR
jgi:DnaK suppressor protein